MAELPPHAAPIRHPPTSTKRDFLQLVAIAGAAIGAGAIAWPLIDTMNPSADVLALSSVEVDLTPDHRGHGHHRGLAGQADLRAPPHRRPRSRRREDVKLARADRAGDRSPRGSRPATTSG